MPRPARKRRHYYRRSFLNRPGFHAGAYVLADVTVTPGKDAGLAVDADLTIADCGRVVSLDFSTWVEDSPAARRNVLHKAHVLRDVVVTFVERLEVAMAEAAD